MSYKNEWFLLEADDNIDEIEHREPTEEFLFYRGGSDRRYRDSQKELRGRAFCGGEKESESFQEILWSI